MSPLILLLAEADPVPKKRCGKENPDKLRSSSGNKIVLTLLTEVVAVHVGLSVVYISRRVFSFSRGTLAMIGAGARVGVGVKTEAEVRVKTGAGVRVKTRAGARTGAGA